MSRPVLRDAASGQRLARGGDRALWLVPWLMLAVLLTGLVRFFRERAPAVLALTGTMSGSLGVYLISGERLRTGQSSGLIAAQMRAWFWLGLVASLVVAAVAPWF